MVKLDYRDPRPIYEQVVDGIEQLALRGALPPDSQLPSVRMLAMELSVNPNTIQRAYSELERRDVIYSAKGRGNFVSESVEGLRRRRLDEIAEKIKSLVKEARTLGATEDQLKKWIKGKGEKDG